MSARPHFGKTEIQDEKVSRAKFEKAVGTEAVDAAMRIRYRLTGLPIGPRAAYLCHGFCELGAVPFVTMLEGSATSSSRTRARSSSS